MKKITVLLAILLLVTPPLLATADILWQDDFDGYHDGMYLSESPYWEDVNCYEPFIFRVATKSGDDLWVKAVESALCIATGGADNPNMKVSIHDVEMSTAHLGLFGGVTRFSMSDEDGYAAVCRVFNDDYNPPSYDGEIYHIDSDYWGDRLATMELPGEVNSISLVAHGNDPVYLEAWFDGHCLTTNDYIYNLTEGYGGIFAEG